MSKPPGWSLSALFNAIHVLSQLVKVRMRFSSKSNSSECAFLVSRQSHRCHHSATRRIVLPCLVIGSSWNGFKIVVVLKLTHILMTIHFGISCSLLPTKQSSRSSKKFSAVQGEHNSLMSFHGVDKIPCNVLILTEDTLELIRKVQPVITPELLFSQYNQSGKLSSYGLINGCPSET